MLRFTILGCGSSPGVPRPNGDWGACDPNEPRNRRLRASLLVEREGEGGTTRIVVDTGPDFRTQCIANGIDRLDAVVLTHPHADHIHGIDDIRTFVLTSKRRMPVWADDPTYKRVEEAFSYAFVQAPGSFYPPICERRRIEPSEPFEIDGPGGTVRFEPIRQLHGQIVSLGFRFGSFAYCSDVSGFSTEAIERLRGVRTLVIDALQYREHPSHFSVDQAITEAREIGAKHVVFTHMHTPLDYRTLLAELPEGFEPGYDGMQLEIATDED